MNLLLRGYSDDVWKQELQDRIDGTNSGGCLPSPVPKRAFRR